LKDGPWKGRKLYDLYKATETPREWFSELFIHAREIGIEIFSSVFSPEDVDFLEQFNPPAYKIASFEITDTNLIKYARGAVPVPAIASSQWDFGGVKYSSMYPRERIASFQNACARQRAAG
jgi:sialic acid synthase SpsE